MSSADSTSVRLVGTAYFADGVPIPNTDLSAFSAGSPESIAVRTDDRGEFVAEGLVDPPTAYRHPREARLHSSAVQGEWHQRVDFAAMWLRIEVRRVDGSPAARTPVVAFLTSDAGKRTLRGGTDEHGIAQWYITEPGELDAVSYIDNGGAIARLAAVTVAPGISARLLRMDAEPSPQSAGMRLRLRCTSGEAAADFLARLVDPDTDLVVRTVRSEDLDSTGAIWGLIPGAYDLVLAGRFGSRPHVYRFGQGLGLEPGASHGVTLLAGEIADVDWEVECGGRIELVVLARDATEPTALWVTPARATTMLGWFDARNDVTWKLMSHVPIGVPVLCDRPLAPGRHALQLVDASGPRKQFEVDIVTGGVTRVVIELP